MLAALERFIRCLVAVIDSRDLTLPLHFEAHQIGGQRRRIPLRIHRLNQMFI